MGDPNGMQIVEVDENAHQHFFEGTEKLLEIWFESKQADAKSLRVIPRRELDEICALAQCEIVSEIHNNKISAYVLSESSLFISDNCLILKTCGTTVPLKALDKIIRCAAKYANQKLITNLFYSRKNFQRPHMQDDTHANIDEECGILDRYVKNGTAYCLGALHQDRWYLYTCNPPRQYMSKPDHTLEIIMQDLDRHVMDIFYTDASEDGYHATKLSGIDKLMPRNTIIDDKLFEPCGYSMNGLIADTAEYVTIHITPEEGFSYVSFETNQSQTCLYTQLCKVIGTFKPQRFLITICADELSELGRLAQKQLWNTVLPGFRRCELQTVVTCEHAVMYARYTTSDVIDEQRNHVIAK